MRVALVVPSYGRPAALAACLASARAQSRPFDEIVVAAREGDEATIAAARAAGAAVATTTEPGVLAAMAAGVRATTSDVVGLTDDDATLPATWAAEVEAAMADHTVGGFGGRDVLYDDGVARPTALTASVGRVTPLGRVIGNHHCGEGPPRDVDVLKGVNAAYRRAALGLPRGLRGDGAQAHFEVACGRFARERGWRLVYDPRHTVAHSPAVRVGEDQRSRPSDDAVAASAFNALRTLPPRLQTRRLLYVLAVGDGACPGVVRWLAALARGEGAVRARRAPSWRGTFDAWRQRRTALAFETFS